jgi:hypothetical protein
MQSRQQQQQQLFAGVVLPWLHQLLFIATVLVLPTGVCIQYSLFVGFGRWDLHALWWRVG